MKKLFVGFVAMIATLNLFAQEPQPATEPQNPEATAQVQTSDPEGLTMKDSKVFLIVNGELKEITEEIWMRNGMQITPSGKLVFANGERAQLRNGETVSLKGAVARPIPIGTEVAVK